MRKLPDPISERWRRSTARRTVGSCCALALGAALCAAPSAQATTQTEPVAMARSDVSSAMPGHEAAVPAADAFAPAVSPSDDFAADAAAGVSMLTPGRFQRSRYLPLQLQFLDRLADGSLQWQARLLGAQQRSASLDSDGTSFSFVAPGESIGAALRVLYSGLSAQTLVLGLEAQKSTPADGQSPADAEVGARYSAYVQDDWRGSGGFSGNAGVRVNRSSATLTQSYPYAALTWQAQPGTALKARYARSSPASTADQGAYVERLARLGNPGADGEGIDMLEATLDQRLDGDLLVRAVAYRWSVATASDAGIDALDDPTRKTIAHGLELSTDKRWAWGSRLRGSVAMQRVFDADGGLAPNAPAWLGKLDFSTRLPLAGLQLGCELRYDVAQRGTDGADWSASAVSNLRLHSDRLANGLDVGVSVHNLLDSRDALPVSYGQDPAGQAGRTVRLDAVYQF